MKRNSWGNGVDKTSGVILGSCTLDGLFVDDVYLFTCLCVVIAESISTRDNADAVALLLDLLDVMKDDAEEIELLLDMHDASSSINVVL